MFILKACRTPMGALGGSLKGFTAPELAGAALGGLLEGTDPARVEEFVLGQAVQAGSGANPAREAARIGKLDSKVSAFTLNQGEASGLLAVILASRGDAEFAVAGGVESSSGAPYLLPSARWGTRMGSAPVLDALLLDARWSRRLAGLARVDHLRALTARDAGLFREEITLLGSGADDLPDISAEIAPADGSALVLLGTEHPTLCRQPLARIVACARGEGEAGAVRRVLQTAGLALRDLDLFELDRPEAFPEVDPAVINARGGAASLGLAQGAEGARKVVTLTHQLRHGNLRYGLAALESDGLGLALILERA